VVSVNKVINGENRRLLQRAKVCVCTGKKEMEVALCRKGKAAGVRVVRRRQIAALEASGAVGRQVWQCAFVRR